MSDQNPVNHKNTDAMRAVLAEMNRQDNKWGSNRDLDPHLWNTILTEEVGEVAKEILDADNPPSIKQLLHLRDEVIQVSAVALQWAESLERIIDKQASE